MDAVSEYVRNQILVFGGTSAIWKYEESFSYNFACAYDNAVGNVVGFVQGDRYHAISGHGHLEGIQLRDRIGHIDWRDEASVEIVESFMVYVIGLVKEKLPLRRVSKL